MKASIGTTLGVSALAVLALWGVAVARARQHYLRGHAAIERRPLEAVRELRTALLLHAPLAPYSRLAATDLGRLAEEARRRGDRRLSDWADEAVATWPLANRSLFRPHRDGTTSRWAAASGAFLVGWVSIVALGTWRGGAWSRWERLAALCGYVLWIATLFLA